jgi:raffinose/stachyose/melibiose transport system permease protein
MRGGRGRPSFLTFVRFLIIPTAFYLFTVISPIFVGIYYSTFNWSGGPKKVFIGIRNYKQLFQNTDFWHSVSNNFMLIFYCLIGQVFLGLLIAILLNTKYLRLRSIYRFVIFLPCILSGVVVTFLWQIIYNANYGLVNWLLRSLNQGSLVRLWLDDPKIVVRSIAIVLIWQYVGQNVVIFLASLQNIEPDIIEAATIDGASAFQRTWRIIMPLMKGTVRVVVILCISGNMRIFEHIYNMTRGGPGTASSVMSVFAYKTSFENLQMGYGSAASVSILAISLASISIANFLLRGEKHG